ncbi:MAG: MBL fold metallo-hydrolase, partial [Acidimicrobiales bacterium]
MRVHILGARGSTPSPGAEFVRYGGHTSCLALAHDGAPPTLVLDAGTGIREVSPLLGQEPFRGTIMLTHLHWDHTQGLPFFRAGDHPEAAAHLYLPGQGPGTAAEDVLARAMSPPHFPIRPGQLRGSWRFHALEPGEYDIEGFAVVAEEVQHKGGRTFGYRVSDGTARLAYVPDHWPTSLGPGPEGLGEYPDALVCLARQVDIVFHDAQYTDEELPTRGSFGHSSVGYAFGLAVRARARQLVLFHHDPWRADVELDALVAAYRCAPLPVAAAAGGMVLD